MEVERFTPHSDKQEKLIWSDAKITLAATGTQWGKSQAGSLWLKRRIHKHTHPKDRFLILAPTYKIMNQSMVPYFLHYMQGLGVYRRADSEFHLSSGGVVFMRTGTDPDSVVGIPNVRAGWLDEAGKAKLYFWENIQARAAAVGADLLLTTSPYSRNWIYKDFIKPIQQGKRKDVAFIKAASWENPYHTFNDPEKKAEAEAKMDPRRFSMVYGGEFGQMAGLVYDCWDEKENICKPFPLPSGTRFFGGIDWGYYPDPFVLVIRAVTPDGRHYGISEFVKTKMTITDIADLCKQKRQVFPIEVFYCDPSQPGHIEELNRAGCTAVGADNDIRRGIDAHYQLIKTRKYKEFEGLMPHSEDERDNYHYPEEDDLGPDDKSKELVPVDQRNHVMDATRYVTISTLHAHKKIQPFVPVEIKDKKQETVAEHLARLRRIRKANEASNW